MRLFSVFICLVILSSCGTNYNGSYAGNATVSFGGQSTNYSATMQLAQSGSSQTGTLTLTPAASSTPGAAPQSPISQGVTGTSNGNQITVTLNPYSTNVYGACSSPMSGTMILNSNVMTGTFVCSTPQITQTLTLTKTN